MELVIGKGARTCECRVRVQNEKRIAKIPPAFRNIRLEDIVPNTSKHSKQPQVIAHMKANPTESYFLAGRPGTGKTLMLWALYRHALERGVSHVVCCTLAELLDEYRSFIRAVKADDQPRYPRLNATQLREDGVRYSIFLDDLDKANPTDYAAEQVFALVNAIYEFRHQIVVTTNKSVEQLKAHYNRSDDRGEPIVRRLIENSTVVEMF